MLLNTFTLENSPFRRLCRIALMDLEEKKEVWDNELTNTNIEINAYNLMFYMKAFNNEFDPDSFSIVIKLYF